ncbi:MAG TPA: Kdo domain containing protein, partial [Flavobacteriaceae bacterium]|nr:Kdo domain containing protein [Flavobacteriaceae bacterium]
YYVCEHLRYDYTFREIINNPNLPDREKLVRHFIRLTFKMHESGIEFKDHSPGNTLIRKVEKGYDFFLVDLNRMRFHKKMSFELRMKNLCRITPQKEMIAIMSDEYAKCIDESPEKVFQSLWSYTEAFQNRFHNKKKWKKRLKLS